MKLRLKQLAFDRIHFDISDGFDPDKYVSSREAKPMGHDFENAQVGIKFQIVPLDRERFDNLEDEHFPFDIQVTVSGKPKTDREFPYTFEITASAMFIIADESDDPSSEELVDYCRQRGVGQVLGPIREMLVSLSSRSYFGDVRLPPVNMAKVLAEAKKAEVESH